MLFLPAAALCCLCSALVTRAAESNQGGSTLTKKIGEKVSFSCGNPQCSGSVDWYQKKERETFKYMQYTSVLTLNNIRRDHSATYYCACWVSDPHRYYIFGSGTKLYVTDEQVVKPVVSVYPAASRAHLEGNSSLLCVASAMFPPLVQFSWKRQKKNGGEAEELPPAEGEQLELRESGRTIAIRMVDGSDSDTYKYSCWVKHEGGTVEAQTQQELPAPAASCPPEREPADLPALQPADLSFQSQCRVKLLCLLYTVLIVKSLVYCCGLSLLMILTNKGASTNCTHAD
ncbi:uncharacterized protein LOC134617650 [Pelmatolapia mariae]|uniref:uncharacterized protein LOC134617650 n=1 Tax=Pelmatolapia mariae TaxID=158779 RepID=UPI002FE5C44D